VTAGYRALRRQRTCKQIERQTLVQFYVAQSRGPPAVADYERSRAELANLRMKISPTPGPAERGRSITL
jgi:hypothetical protein